MNRPLALISCLTGLTASGAFAQTIYNDLDSGTDGVAFIGDLVIDDLTVEGGGLLQSATIALTAEGGGGTIFTDVGFSLAVDGGDGVPDLDGTGDDWFLFTTMRPGVEVAVGGVTEVTFDLRELWSIIPDNALVFGGVQLSNPNAGHLFYGSPTIGSTSDIVFSFNAMGPVPVPSVTDPELENSDALAFRLEVVELPGPGDGVGVVGEPIDFESLEEGFQGLELTVDGVTFFEGLDGFPPPEPGMLAVDDGTGVWDANPDMLDFVSDNLLQLNSFSPGPDGYTFAILKSLKMDIDGQVTGLPTAVRLSVAYVVEGPDTDFRESTITLLALRDGEMVASASIHPDNVLGESGGGTFTFGASTIEVSGVEFDSLVLFNNGPGPFGGVQMGIDNVIIGAASCAGDLDETGVVNVIDLLDLLAAWGACPNEGDCPADLNDDDVVNVMDLLILLANWGACG
jgi:hypothetical protein